MTDQRSLHSEASAELSQDTADIWRNEIQQRVAGYRTRRGRRIEGAFSMRFPFPPPGKEGWDSATGAPAQSSDSLELSDSEQVADKTVAIAEAADTTEVANSQTGDLAWSTAEPEVAPADFAALPQLVADNPPSTLPEAPVEVESDEPVPLPPPRPRPKRKVIAFPRQAMAAQELHRLADPVLLEQPRILDVPEELEALPTTPFLDGLQFGPAVQPVAAPHVDNVELPFVSAARARRVYAGGLDCLLVAVGTAVFAAVGYKMLPNLAFTKPLLLTAAALAVLLWATYQYVLLVYGGATAGMRIAKIRLSTFKGSAPSRQQRRHRTIALYFSTASFAMGLLWALVDVDSLCWHDRISRTYLTDRE